MAQLYDMSAHPVQRFVNRTENWSLCTSLGAFQGRRQDCLRWAIIEFYINWKLISKYLTENFVLFFLALFCPSIVLLFPLIYIYQEIISGKDYQLDSKRINFAYLCTEDNATWDTSWLMIIKQKGRALFI